MNTIRRLERFLKKSPEQMWETVRFFETMWLSRLPYAPHRVRLRLANQEHLAFWWSYFPASFHPDRSMFEYWGTDIGDLRFLWTHLQPGMTFLDIGAYHGIYSILAAKRLGASGRVVAFEPSPRERHRMLLHLRYNRIKSVTLEPFALAAEAGKAQLAVVVEGFTTMNSLRRPQIEHPIIEVMVETIPLDAYLIQKQIGKVDFMKIDTEGGEVEAFRGAHALLSDSRPFIICEVLDQVTRAWGYPAAEIMSLLRGYDFEWFDILSDGSLLQHSPKKEYPEGRNYLAVPREKQSFLPLRIQS
jgi:FkbM family methyltransferase